MEDGREMIESIYLSEASLAQGPPAALKMIPGLLQPSFTEGSKDVCLLSFTYSGAFPAFPSRSGATGKQGNGLVYLCTHGDADLRT